ncbi:hypothetical protein GCM10010402_22620 [Actinomadura luteofluorescens]|nr:Sigma-70 region 2 [Actinomadura glauciflava]
MDLAGSIGPSIWPTRPCRTRPRWPWDAPPPNTGTWIVTTARNRAIDRLRRESSR